MTRKALTVIGWLDPTAAMKCDQLRAAFLSGYGKPQKVIGRNIGKPSQKTTCPARNYQDGEKLF